MKQLNQLDEIKTIRADEYYMDRVVLTVRYNTTTELVKDIIKRVNKNQDF